MHLCTKKTSKNKCVCVYTILFRISLSKSVAFLGQTTLFLRKRNPAYIACNLRAYLFCLSDTRYNYCIELKVCIFVIMHITELAVYTELNSSTSKSKRIVVFENWD